MEEQVQNPMIQQIPSQLVNVPPVSPEHTKSKLPIFLIVIILMVLIGLGGAAIGRYLNFSQATLPQPTLAPRPTLTPLPTTISDNSAKNLKTYTNNYYHISLQIPSEWKTKDYEKEDGRQAFILTSANEEISIETPELDTRNEGKKSSIRIKQDLGTQTVQLGKYSLPRIRYINDFNETRDYIPLYDIPFQKFMNLSFTVKGDYEKNNQTLVSILETFKFTQKEPSLDTFISYKLPKGWVKKKNNTANETDYKLLSFVSADFKSVEGIEGESIIKGATLVVSRDLKNSRKTMVETIESSILNNESNKAKSIKVGKIDGLNLFNCFWASCYDNYYVEKDNYYWQIMFSCGESCSTKAEIDASKYAKDRDAFLNSFSFKFTQ